MGIEQLPIIFNTSQTKCGSKSLPPKFCKHNATNTDTAGGLIIFRSSSFEEVNNNIPTVQIATSTPRLKRIILTTNSLPKKREATGMAKKP